MKHTRSLTIFSAILIYMSSVMTTSAETLVRTQITPGNDANVQMRNYAFARCITLSFDSIEEIRTDAEAASSAYIEPRQLNNKDVRNMDKFVKRWLKEPYLGKFSPDLKIMRCIDFQQSADMATGWTAHPARSYDAPTQLNNFALAHCIGNAFDNETVRDDASSATAAYVEFGKNDISDYSRLAVFVREWLKRSNLDPAEPQSKLTQCLDIYHGTDLREIVTLYTNEKLEPLRSFAINYCLSIDNGVHQEVRDTAKKEADAMMASGQMSAKAQQRISVLAEEWLKQSHTMPDDGCDGLYSSPALLEVIRPYATLTK